jgi:hypothetical protein
LSNPERIIEFLDEHSHVEDGALIGELDKLIANSEGSYKTDLRILLNAITKDD